MPPASKTIQDKIFNSITNARNQAGYGNSLVPYHTHDGINSPKLQQTFIIPYTLPGTSPATSGNYSTFFTAFQTLYIVSISEVHVTAGTDAGSVSLQIEHLTGTTAPGGGTNLLATAFNLKGTINTVQSTNIIGSTGLVTFAKNVSRILHTNDRLGLVLTGTPTSVANLTVTITLST